MIRSLIGMIATLIAASLMSGCASTGSPGSNPDCAACNVTFDVCKREDDYDACFAMHRYCRAWCAEAESCDEACDGADWGCKASPTSRSTCDRSDAACREFCATRDSTPVTDSGVETEMTER